MLIEFLRRFFARKTVSGDTPASQPSTSAAQPRPPPLPVTQPQQQGAVLHPPPPSQGRPNAPPLQPTARPPASSSAPAMPAAATPNLMPAGEVARPAAPAPPTPKAAENREARVSPTPAPLKPSQRRLALRDERLAHKHASREHVVTARRPHKQYFTGDEARRLFSTTMRSRDRPLRDLVTDADQLARYGLPVWQTEEALAGALELDRKALRRFSIHSAGDRSMHYVTFAIPKRSGGERLIMAPKARLKRLQRRLHALLVSKLPVSEFAHGFRNGHSVRSNAEPHVGRNVILQLDLKDFFGSIHFGRVRGLLIAFGYGFPVATVLATLMTEAPRQPVMVGETRFFPPAGPRACPQGAPTSPGLSNAVVVKMDRRLAGLAQRYGFVYTRYADDLTFSGDDIAAAHALRLLARRVVEEEGFALNDDKTRLTRSGSRQTVTGVVVNDVLGLSRQERRRLRAAIHQYANAHAAGNADPALLARLDGKVAYVSMLNAGQAHRLAPRSSSG